jgi:DNA-binding TFAR19-related protein (PDSD5 family)
MPLAAAIAVTLVLFAAVAAGLALVGRSRMKRVSPLVRPRTIDAIRQDLIQLASPGRLSTVATPPKQTIETVKEDIEWVKHPTKSGMR